MIAVATAGYTVVGIGLLVAFEGLAPTGSPAEPASSELTDAALSGG